MASGLRLTINLDAPEPATRQIVDQLRALLVEGVLRPGDAVPSVRRLAIDLGLHFNTIADAYRTLAAEGWLDVAQGRAARVLHRQPPAASPDERTTFHDRLRRLVADARARGLSSGAVARELASVADGLKS